MAEPLAVDPTRLTAAASKLSELVFPAPPAPMQVAGTDAVSAAINETMPGIESLVSDGLPGVTAALRRTAGRMIAAADIYTKADQSLGQALSQDGFDGAAPTLGAMAAASGQTDAGTLGAATLGGPASAPGQLPGAAGGTAAVAGVGQQFAEAVSGQVAAVTPHLQATVPQLVQLAPLGQQLTPMGQQVGQSVQQAASQASQGGGSPAQLASDNKPDGENQDDDGDDETQSADRAAAGSATLVSAPVADTAAAAGTPASGGAAGPV